jgi:hypothetical protein
MGLDYDYPDDGSKPCSKEPLKVKSDGVHCGEIRKVKDGFQYFAKSAKTGGNVFDKLSGVQNHLQTAQTPRPKEDRKDDQSDGKLDKKLKTATDRIRETEKELKGMGEAMDGAMTLIQACSDLLSLQLESKTDLNLLKENITYDETEADGHSLLEDLTAFIDSGE